MDMTLHKIMDLLWTKDLKERDFCVALGINKSAVTDWKSGKTKSYNKCLEQIAEYLKVDSSYLTEPSIVLSAPDEIQLIEDYRALSGQGKEVIRQTMHMALNTYKKDTGIPGMEIADEIAP